MQDFPQQQQEQQQQESSTDSAILQVPAMIYKGVDEATTNSKKSQRLLNAIILSNNNISTMTMTNGMIGPVMKLRKCGSWFLKKMEMKKLWQSHRSTNWD